MRFLILWDYLLFGFFIFWMGFRSQVLVKNLVMLLKSNLGNHVDVFSNYYFRLLSAVDLHAVKD
jgi:hypothetical protein